MFLYPIFKPLIERGYRLVLLDCLGKGASTRIVELPVQATQSVEAIDAYQLGWLKKWFDVMIASKDLPE